MTTIGVNTPSWVGLIVGLLPLVVFGGIVVLMGSRGSRFIPRLSASDKYDKLKKIADLKDRGALTEREFEAEKRKISAETDANGTSPSPKARGVR